jgi:very-short-patch-repair endonuclease
VNEAQRRALSLLDFLEAFYRRQFPPVRNVANYGDFLLREPELPDVPGVTLMPGGRRWLTLKLVTHPPAPSVPDDLVDYVEEGELTPHVEPVLRDISDEDERTLAQELLDNWVTETWLPWSEKWLEIERGRAFYKRAFDLRTRVERDREIYELVWGFGRMRWNGQSEECDHPLLSVPIEIEHDRTDGSLALVPAGPVTVEYAFLADLPLADRAGYLDRRRSSEEIELDPWNAETIRPEYEGLLRSIDFDGTFGQPPSGSHAAAEEGWVLYLRRRQTDYFAFLEAQRQVLIEQPECIPLPIASIVVDEPSRLVGELGVQWGEAEAVELLLPLPANEEQHAILNRAACRAGVTAQGPPGTGKTHTIANLISHFVAHGQRVLVVAEKEQAIKVLADKVPEGIRALVVPNLGSDAEARTRLEQSITSVQAGVYNPTTVPSLSEIERRMSVMEDISSRIALLSGELRERSMAEASPCPPSIAAPGRTTPSEVASWLAQEELAYDYIPDHLSAGDTCPIGPFELAQLVGTLEDIGPTDLREALNTLPPTTLPTKSVLSEEDAELEQLEVRLAAGTITDWSSIDLAEPESLDDLAIQINAMWSWMTKWSGSWLARVQDELSDPGYQRAWIEFASTVRRELNLADDLSRSLLTHSIVIPDELGGAPTFRSALESAHSRLESGKSLGLWKKDARDAVERCVVDGAKPTNAVAVRLCLDELDLRAARRRLATAWINQTSRVGAPSLESTQPEHEIRELVRELEWQLDWRATRWPALLDTLAHLGISAPSVPDADEFTQLHLTSGLFTVRRRYRVLVRDRTELGTYLTEEGRRAEAAPTWSDLRDALTERDWERWERCQERCARLHSIQERAVRAEDIRTRLEKSAPLWAAQITDTGGEAAGDPAHLSEAWQWRCAESWVSEMNSRRSAAFLERSIEDANRQRLRAVEDVVVGRAWRHLADNFSDHHRIALQQYVTASKRLGKGHSKYAARFQREVRNALNDAKDAVPVWIMTLSKAMESFRPAAEPPFDVLIVDEASQVGIEAIPVLGLARRAIIVGDDKQTSPENVGLNREAIFGLIEEHLSEIPKYQTLFDPDTSLYDLAAMKFPDIVMLREHFRCLPEIIAFSNHRYYGGNIEALRDQRPSPGWQPTGTVDVRVGYRKPGLDLNENEAVAVVDLIAELVERPEYEAMTFGVISLLGAKQAPRIQELLLDRLGPVVIEERHIRCGDAASFQGDERDVMVISLVVAPDASGQLGRIGAMTGKPAERRINVATSRAANQLWVVHSIQPEDFPSQDPRAELIRHCREPALVEEMSDRLFEKCESEFERRVVGDIVARGFRHVRTQWVAGNYRIDIVIEGPEGRRLAVECDGDIWHAEDQWDRDRARQTVLMRAGWKFERISGSAYFRDPAGALEPLWARLEELGIPTGEWMESAALAPPRRVVESVGMSGTEFGIDESRAGVDPRENVPEAHEVGSEPYLGAEDIPVPSNHLPDAVMESGGEGLADAIELDGIAGQLWNNEISTPVGRPEDLPSRQPGSSPRYLEVSGSRQSALVPYIQWQQSAVSEATEASQEELIEALVAIVSAEGPMLARRAYLMYHQASGGQRVGKDIRSALNRAAYAAIRGGRLSQIRDECPGQVDKTLYVPGSSPVVTRVLGTRDLYEVPQSEIRALIEQLGLSNAPLNQVCRAVLDAYGLRKLTQKALAFVAECLAYHWEPA